MKFHKSVSPYHHKPSCFTLLDHFQIETVLIQNSKALVLKLNVRGVFFLMNEGPTLGSVVKDLLFCSSFCETISPALIAPWRTQPALRLQECKGSNAKGCVGGEGGGVFYST